jgi:hypothetical protein
LVADATAFSKHPARFRLSAADVRSVTHNNADDVDAAALIKRAIERAGGPGPYNKRNDSRLILAAADVSKMAANSRSFRRFLRCVGHPDYSGQSRRPKPRPT